jgi:hypothetical protein
MDIESLEVTRHQSKLCSDGVVVLFVAIYDIVWEWLLKLSCPVARYRNLTPNHYRFVCVRLYLCNVKILDKDQYLPVRLNDLGHLDRLTSSY